MIEGGGALRRLVGDEERFAREHWGSRPLLRERAGDFGDLLRLPHVDHLVTETLMRLPGMRLVRDGETLPASSYTRTIRVGSRSVREVVRPERVLALFGEGATIVLQALHRQWAPVARFCGDLEVDLTHPVQANAYVTPKESRGFGLHHDTHDVFVVQTHGRKEWRVYAPIVERAGPEQPWSRDLGDPGEVIVGAELGPGDVLYIPRGFPHEASAREEVSIHLTIGVSVRTWIDIWRHVMESAPDHAAFREALPIGFARDPDALADEMATETREFHAWFEKAAGREAAAGFARAFWKRRRAPLAGQLAQVAALDRLDERSELRVRRGIPFAVSREGEEAAVLLGSRELRMPRFCEPALRRIAEAPGTTSPGELPGLDPASRLVLVRRLVREGALEVVDGER